MSKYTTQVRFICESKSGLDDNAGFDDINTVLANSWNQIFTTSVTFFDEAYRSVLCQKILKHYYLREICSETVGIWMLWMNERLEMIMPYYNKLYNSELIQFNPMHDVNVTRTYNRDVDNTENATGTSEGTSTNTNRDLYSDTPQGAITGLENETYLTNARKVTDNGATTGEFENNREANSTEEYVETLVGKHGAGNFSKMLQDFRDTFLNIDMMVIDEFKDLFFGLW